MLAGKAWENDLLECAFGGIHSVSQYQDTLDHDKGGKSAISGCHFHWIFVNFLQWIFSLFSRFSVQFSKEMALKVEKIARSPGREKVVESCHVCGCHGFFGPDTC